MARANPPIATRPNQSFLHQVSAALTNNGPVHAKREQSRQNLLLRLHKSLNQTLQQPSSLLPPEVYRLIEHAWRQSLAVPGPLTTQIQSLSIEQLQQLLQLHLTMNRAQLPLSFPPSTLPTLDLDISGRPQLKSTSSEGGIHHRPLQDWGIPANTVSNVDRSSRFSSNETTTEESPPEVIARGVIKDIANAIDKVPDLKDAGILMQLPDSPPILLRSSNHFSRLKTYVLIKVVSPSQKDKSSWWDKYNGVLLNCGAAVASWAGVIFGAGASIPSAGSSISITLLTLGSAAATTAQCGLAITKTSSEKFSEWLETSDGEWINILDIALDIASLAGGIKSAILVVKNGSALIKRSRYAKYLQQIPKGTLLKTLGKMEKSGKDISFFRESVEQLSKNSQIIQKIDPANISSIKGLTNNIFKRSLPYIAKQIDTEKVVMLSDSIATSLSGLSSYYGGVGSKNLGVIKVFISVYQE